MRTTLVSKKLTGWSALACLAILRIAGAQSQGANVDKLVVTAGWEADKPLQSRSAIEVKMNRQLQPSEGRLAVLIGRLDVTSLLDQSGNGVRYTPTVLPLAQGAFEVLVYIVSAADEWKEVARLPGIVADPQGSSGAVPKEAARNPAQPAAPATPSAGNKITWKPSITIGMKSQPAVSQFPAAGVLPRRRFADATLQGMLQNGVTLGGLRFENQFDVVGTSFRNEALRFSERGAGAPLVDLSHYLMVLKFGKAEVKAGQITVGGNRHMINSFASRGMTVTTPLFSWLDLSLAAVNGSNIVGWDNFLGLSNRRHQILTGTVGVEFLPKRPGGARLEISALDGSLLPVSGFTQSVVNDTERSRGLGGRLFISDKSQRFKLDGGFTRSTFTNPFDPQLAQGENVVPVKKTTENARYADASVGILRERHIGKTRILNLMFNYRHEQVDPLFRSVAASVQADRLQNQYEMAGNLGQVNVSFSHTRSNNNLDHLNSILTTLTRQNALNFSAPLSGLLGTPAKSAAWLPLLIYSDFRGHSFGESFPAVGFISLHQIPDQLNSVQTLSLEWQMSRWHWGYRFNRSFQDNRQPGRELADLRNLINDATFGVSARSNLDLGWELDAEDAHNFEEKRTDRLWRASASANWRMTQQMILTLTLSGTLAGDLDHARKTRNSEADIQWSYRLGNSRPDWKRVQSQFSIRYGNRYAFVSDRFANSVNLTKLQTLNINLSFAFF